MARVLKSKATIYLSHPSSSYRLFKISEAATRSLASGFGGSKDTVLTQFQFRLYATQSLKTSPFRNFIEKSLHRVEAYFEERRKDSAKKKEERRKGKIGMVSFCSFDLPMNCVGDYRVPGISQFAVDEINKRENAALVLEGVVTAEVSAIDGKVYCITLEATDSGNRYTYNVTVYEYLDDSKKHLKLLKYTLESSSPLEQEVAMSFGSGFGGSKDTARTTSIKKKEDTARSVTNPFQLQSRMYATRSQNTSPFRDFIKKSLHHISDYLQKPLQGINRREHSDRLTNCNGDFVTPIFPYQKDKVPFLSQFAVDEINKRENSAIMLERVVTAGVKLLYGMVYHITLEVTDSGNRNIYNVIVFETYVGKKDLLNFKLASCPPLDRDSLFLGNDTYDSSTMLDNNIEFGKVPRLINCNGYKVPSLCRFAVDEINKRENAALVLDRVVTAALRLICGTVYRITLEATDSGNRNTYDVIAYSDSNVNHNLWEFTLESSSPLKQANHQFKGQEHEELPC